MIFLITLKTIKRVSKDYGKTGGRPDGTTLSTGFEKYDKDGTGGPRQSMGQDKDREKKKLFYPEK